MVQFIQYDPTAQKLKKCPRVSPGVTTPSGNPTKRPRISPTMTTTPGTHELVDIHARLSPSARMDLALKVLDIGSLSITKLLKHRLDSTEPCHFKNMFLSEGGGLELFIKELVEQHPTTEDCISQVVGHNLVLKKVSAEMDLVKAYAFLSSTEVTPHSMRDWSVGVVERRFGRRPDWSEITQPPLIASRCFHGA
jgi:hypothetical protein